MSLSDPKTRNSEPTAANAGVPASNFALPIALPEPSALKVRAKGHSITDRTLQAIQVCTDFVCACIALPLSLLLLSIISAQRYNSLQNFGSNLKLDSYFPLAAIMALALGGMYRVTHRRLQPSAFLEIRELCFGVGSGCVLAIASGALLHVAFGLTEPNATQLVLAVIGTVFVISIGRMITRYFLHALTTTRVVVVGAGKIADRVLLSVRQDPGMTLVGRVVDLDVIEGDVGMTGAIGHVSDLPRLCHQLDIHRILVASPDKVTPDSLNTYRQLQESVHIAIVPQCFELTSWRSRLTDLAGMPFLEIARPHLSVWDQFMKRMFDLFISSVVLLVSSPLLLVVAIGVKLSSPGPVLFRQVRLGRGQLPFTIIKFRTMNLDTGTPARTDEVDEEPRDEDRPLHELRKKGDESYRITKFGAFLRRTSIDEIPQFWSVFRGDMSVVGPRPFIPSESGVAGWGSRRFDVRPGITGLWQVSGRNDLTRTDLVQLDYLYVASWSLWWDLKIMWETPKTMARGTGAY
jgi:exopolysaccharide biosynthesis polyprenyl glycosylphosphotransferase